MVLAQEDRARTAASAKAMLLEIFIFKSPLSNRDQFATSLAACSVAWAVLETSLPTPRTVLAQDASNRTALKAIAIFVEIFVILLSIQKYKEAELPWSGLDRRRADTALPVRDSNARGKNMFNRPAIFVNSRL
jgi:hypothetical protein